ncbi:hypothetical protein C8J57DRAFT_1382287 [Mycena rebaudengoi]|nr:hypothetical protein C8J57DRAFT_1382287 [Mycena rebaudengoi]
MASFPGSAICPRCSKSVYAAEQTMGPGRKFYHKPCLSCMTCKKRLDSFTLLEHDQEPYCKSCHAKNFGTHNVANRANTDPLLSSPTRRRTDDDANVASPVSDGESAATGIPAHAGRFGVAALPRTVPLEPAGGDGDDPEFDFLRQDPAAHDERLTPSKATRPIAERYATAAAVQRRHMTGDDSYLSSSGDGSPTHKPIPRSLTGGSPRRYGGDNPACAKCGKSVYFAEQVKAVSKIWHKLCLRCTECNSSLDSNRLRDHDGDPFCGRCHSKLYGKGGLDK